MKIDVSTNSNGVLYTIQSEKGTCTVECGDDLSLKVKGPKNIISDSIGGIGDENETEAWFQDKDFKTASEAVSNILEILKTMIN